MADHPSSSPSSLSDGESESSQADSDSSGDFSSASSGTGHPSPSPSSESESESFEEDDWDSSCDRTARDSAATATRAQQSAAPPGYPAVPPRPAARAAQPASFIDRFTFPGFGETITQAFTVGCERPPVAPPGQRPGAPAAAAAPSGFVMPDDVRQMKAAFGALVSALGRAAASSDAAAEQAARQEAIAAATDAYRMARAIIRAADESSQADSGDSSSASSGPSPSHSSLSDVESESQTDWDYPFVTSSAFTDSSTNLTTENSHEKTEDEGDSSSASSDSSTNETTVKKVHFFRMLLRLGDDEDATPKSDKVIITDFISTDLKPQDMDCGKFTEMRKTAQQRVTKWNCACDLFPALLKIEGSTEKDGIGLAIVSCHGIMKGDEQYIGISEKSTCKRCVSPIPLSKVMAALNSTKKNLSCALLACRTQVEPDSGDDNSFDVSSLVTPYVSLVLPCGPGSTHWTSICVDEMRLLLLKTLGECKPVREALESLHGQFFYAIRQFFLRPSDVTISEDSTEMQRKVNETPIQVIMHKDWMRHEETNEDGLALQDRPIIEELPPHEKLGTLLAKYKDNKSSDKERYRAVEELRFLIALNWEEITAIYSKDPMTPFLNDILEALHTESDGKMTKRLVQVVVEAAMKSIHRTAGFQTWRGIVGFIENCLGTGSVSLKTIALSILVKVPNLFGKDSKSPLSIMKNCLIDTNPDIQSLAMEWISYFLQIKETWDLSPLIPILIQRAEERMIIAEKGNEIYLIVSLVFLTIRFPDSFPPQSVISIVKKGLQSSTSERLKYMLIGLLLPLINKDPNGETAWATELDQESMENLVVILRYYSSSTDSDLKGMALAIHHKIPGALASDPIAAAEIFEKLLEDSDKNTRGAALIALCAYYIKVDEDGDLKIQSAIVPFVPTIIELAMDRFDETVIHILSALAKCNQFYKAMMDQGHIEAALKCCMQVDIEPLISDDYRDHLDSECLERLQNALKTSDILKPLSDIANSLMQSDKWREQCNGLHGLIAIAKHGSGSMDGYIEKIIPLLRDTNPRVRILACLALEQISSHSESDFTNRTHKMIIPALVSALSDEIPKVVARVASTLQSMVIKDQSYKHMPKEILIHHAEPLIDATLECAQKWKEHMGKNDFPYIQSIQYPMIEMLFFSMKVAEESIAPHYDNLISLLKNGLENYLNADIIVLKMFPQFLECILNCISLIGSVVEKGKFINDVKEVMVLLVGKSSRFKWYADHAFDGFARWCAIIGSDFAPLLPIVMDDVLKWASALPCMRCPCSEEHEGGIWCKDARGYRGFIMDPISVPKGRDNADATLSTFSRTLGVDFAPYVNEIFKAAQQHLAYPSFDKDCWSADIFPLLLACLDTQGVGAKRVLWIEYWPALQKAVKEVNSNKYSAKAIKSITRSIEQLGLEGVNENETAAICELIAYEVEAVVRRKQEKIDKDSKASSIPGYFDCNAHEDKKEYETGAIDALNELCKVGAQILGPSFIISGFPQSELIGDDGVEKNLSLDKEYSNDGIYETVE